MVEFLKNISPFRRKRKRGARVYPGVSMYLILVLILLILEKGFLSGLSVFGIVPQLVMVFLVIWTYWVMKGKNKGWLSYFILVVSSGLLIDIVSGNTLGNTAIYFLLNSVISFLVFSLFPHINKWVVISLSLIIVSLVFNLTVYLVSIFLNNPYQISLVELLVKQSLANWMFGLLLIPIVGFFQKTFFTPSELEIN